MTDDEQTAQLHHAWSQKKIDNTPTREPPMAGYAHGKHIANKLGWGSPLLQIQTTLRNRNSMEQSLSQGQEKSQHAWHIWPPELSKGPRQPTMAAPRMGAWPADNPARWRHPRWPLHVPCPRARFIPNSFALKGYLSPAGDVANGCHLCWRHPKQVPLPLVTPQARASTACNPIDECQPCWWHR